MVAPRKIGVIGCGNISYTYLNNLVNTFHIVDVAAIADLHPEKVQRRSEQFGGLKISTMEDILADPEIEVVLNITEIKKHPAISEAILKAGKHVHSEKMMATTFEGGKKLVELAKSKGLRFGQAPDTFLGRGLQTCRYILDKGLIGEPISMHAMCMRGGGRLFGDRAWTESPSFLEQGGGIPYDMGGYYIYAMINMLGPVARVAGFGRTLSDISEFGNVRHPDYGKEFTIGSPTMMTAVLEFQNKVQANLTVMGESHVGEIPRLEIYGTEGTLIMPDPNMYHGPIYFMRGNDRTRECEKFPLTHGYGKFTPEDQFVGTAEEMSWRDSYRGLGVADLLYAIKNNRAHRCSAEMGLHALEVVHGVEESCRENIMYNMTTTCERPEALAPGYIYGTGMESVLDI